MSIIKNTAKQDLLFIPYRDDGKHVGVGAAWFRGGEPIISPNYARYVNADDVSNLNFVIAVYFIDSNYPKQAEFGGSISAYGVGVSVSFKEQSPTTDLIIGPHDFAVVYLESNELKVKIDPSGTVEKDHLRGW